MSALDGWTVHEPSSDLHMWPRLHILTEAAAAADHAATADILAGWGGTGPHCHRPETTLGMAQLYATAQGRLHTAWELCHRLRAPAAEHESDFVAWACVRPSGIQFRARSQRGARWMATHWGGLVVRLVDEVVRRRRLERETDTLRRAVAFALAIGALYDAVTAALGGTPERQMICGVRAGRLLIQGPAWWTGARQDEGWVSADAARAFVAGGPLSVLASVEVRS